MSDIERKALRLEQKRMDLGWEVARLTHLGRCGCGAGNLFSLCAVLYLLGAKPWQWVVMLALVFALNLAGGALARIRYEQARRRLGEERDA